MPATLTAPRSRLQRLASSWRACQPVTTVLISIALVGNVIGLGQNLRNGIVGQAVICGVLIIIMGVALRALALGTARAIKEAW